MIELEKLEWSNMFSYGEDNVIYLNQDKLTQVLGKNGRGKSSIALILEEVLYNKNSKGKKKSSILNRYIGKNKKYCATLHFSKYLDRYVVVIERGSTQKITLLKNGEDISEHTATATYKLLESIIGIDHKTFTQIVYKSSAISSEFLTSSDSVRKKFLIDLLNLSKYTRIGEYFKDKASTLNKSLANLQGKLQVTETILNRYSSRDLSLKSTIFVPVMDNSLLAARHSEVSKKITDISSINSKIKNNNNNIKAANSYVLPEPPETLSISDTEELSSRRAVLQSQVHSNNQRLSELGGLSDTCPTCGSSLDITESKALAEELNTSNTLLSNELKELSEELIKIKDSNNRVIGYNNCVKEKARLDALVDTSLDTELLNLEQLQIELASIEEKINSTKDSIRKATEFNNSVLAHNSEVKLIKQQIEEAEKDLLLIKNDINKINSELNTTGILVKTFSSSGLVAYKIENLIKTLEETTNEYLVELSNGRFQLFFELSGNDKLDCKIIDNGHTVDIVDLSSGELSNISVAVLLSIRKLMQQLSDTKINLLFLDETIAYLDDESKEKLIEILQNEEHLNTFLVSHGYTHPLLKKINVVKKNNISKILED